MREVLNLEIRVGMDPDGRWVARIPDWPGIEGFADSGLEAVGWAQVQALRAVADLVEMGCSRGRGLTLRFTSPVWRQAPVKERQSTTRLKRPKGRPGRPS